jgi:hypothetical protein
MFEGGKRMIKSVKVTPLYKKVENLEKKQITGFGVFIECGINDADEIFNLLKNMTFGRYFTETGEEEDDD